VLYYLIPTTTKYKDIVLPKLLNSLHTQNNIIIAVNNAEENKIEQRDNIITYYSTNNSFEYLVLPVALELLKEDDHIFWLHDTCECGEKFDSIINGFDYTHYNFVDVYHGQCNFGIYSISFLKKDQEFISSLSNIDKTNAVEFEGRYYHKFRNKMGAFPNSTVVNKETVDVYNNGTKRLVEYYSGIDLYKFKANWWFRRDWVVTA